MKKLFLFFILFFAVIATAQNYYPKLNNYILTDEESILAKSPEFAKFSTELLRVTNKIFYKNFQFSGAENTSIFYSLQLIPKKDTVSNVFNSKITLVFDKEFNTKADGIPMTYQQHKSFEAKKLKSVLTLDKGGVYLEFSDRLFRPGKLFQENLRYNITSVETTIENGIAEFKMFGAFPEEIKLKRSPTQEIKEINLIVEQNKVKIIVPYFDRKENPKNWLLYEADFD